MTDQVIAPYPESDGTATGGWSGSETSRERASRDVERGALRGRQRDALFYAEMSTHRGITVKDLRDVTGWHHGQASSALTTLHMAGRLERLTERRDRCLIYVTPNWVRGRGTSPYRPNRVNQAQVTLAVLEGYLTHRVYDAMMSGLHEARSEERISEAEHGNGMELLSTLMEGSD